MSRYQKGKINRDFTEARDSQWQWHQLGRMQVCTSLQTDKNASTPPLSFLQAGCPSCRPTNSFKALKGHRNTLVYYSAPIGWRSIVMSVSVCVCVCVCLSAIISSERHVRSSPIFYASYIMAVARFSSGSRSDTLCTSGLWMTSHLLTSQGCSTSPPS